MAFRSAGTATSVAVATATGTPGAPAGFVANDILIIVASIDGAAGTITFPSGFTQLFLQSLTLDGQTVAVGWKRAVGSDSLACTGMGTTVSKLLRCFAWSGRNTTNPPVSGTVTANNSANTTPVTLTAPTVTCILGDDLFWIGGPDAINPLTGTNTFTQPTGYTSQGLSVDTINEGCAICPATKDNNAAGATGSVAGTFAYTTGSSCGWCAALVRIPVAAATGIRIPYMGNPGMGFGMGF